MVHFPLKINQRIQLIKNSWLIIPEKLNNNAEPQNLDPCFNFKYVDSLSPFMYINKSRMNVLSKNILKLQNYQLIAMSHAKKFQMWGSWGDILDMGSLRTWKNSSTLSTKEWGDSSKNNNSLFSISNSISIILPASSDSRQILQWIDLHGPGYS